MTLIACGEAAFPSFFTEYQPLSPTTILVITFWAPQWGAADAEIKVPSGEHTELKRAPFKAWSRSAYCHTC